MKIYTLLIAILLVTNCKTDKKAKKQEMQAKKEHPFYVGTYTNGTSKGIYKYALLEDGGLKKIGLAATSDNPSFLALSTNKKNLLAVNEINSNNGSGTVESYKIIDDSLSLINKSSSGGAHPCFITINTEGYVLTANYTGGNIGLHKLQENGAISALLDVEQHTGKGTTDRQEAPHAHSAWFEPKNETNVVSVDLGTNELWFSSIETKQQKLVPSVHDNIQMAEGAGPRHLTFHSNGEWVYVMNELNATVTQLKKTDNGTYEKGASISTLPESYSGENTCADIHISSDGKFLYASNRGHNSIAIFKVNETNGTLTFVAHEPTRGDGPRNFSLSLDNEFLLVANQLTNNIVSFKRNKTTGLLTMVTQIDAPTPVCILFY